MKNWRSSIATMAALGALAIVPVTKSHAYTECGGLVLTKVYTDGGGNFLVATGSSTFNGYIPLSAASYKTVVAIALAAKLSGSTVTIRYQANGVTCGSAAWNELIDGIGM